MTVILVPSAANRQAYSQPITPPPTTASDSGMRSRSRIVSESSTSGSSKGTPGGRSGELPVAIRIASAGEPARARRSSPPMRTSDLLRPDELGRAGDDGDAVAVEVARDLRDLLPGDRVQASHELAQAGVAIDVQGHAVEVAALEAGDVQRRLAQRLRRQRAGVHAGAADLARLLDERDLLAEVGGLHRALLARGTRADHHQVEPLCVVRHRSRFTGPSKRRKHAWLVRPWPSELAVREAGQVAAHLVLVVEVERREREAFVIAALGDAPRPRDRRSARGRSSVAGRRGGRAGRARTRTAGSRSRARAAARASDPCRSRA